MEKLALRLSGHYEEAFKLSSHPDGVVVVDSEIIKGYINGEGENENFSGEALNFSNLPVDKMVTLFNTNGKLKNDYFKFGLYNMLSEDNFNLMLSSIECPYSGLETLVEYVLQENKSLVKFKKFNLIFFKYSPI